MNPRRESLAALIAAAVVAVPGAAGAQQVLIDGPTAPAIDVQTFQPPPSPHGGLAVESAQASRHLEVSGGLLVHYAHEPLVFLTDRGEQIPIVDQQLTADLLTAIGLFDLAELGLALPLVLSNGVGDQTISPQATGGATLGDMRVRLKIPILSPERDTVGLAPTFQVGLPTGDEGAFTSSGGLYARPGLITDAQLGRVRLALNLAANLQGERRFGDIAVGHQLLYGLGATVEVLPATLLASAEVFGSSAFDELLSNVEESPLEALIGVEYRTPLGLAVELGAGAGLVAGVGAPAFRLVGGVRYASWDEDLDDDGILDHVDQCTRAPEDRDGFQDEDGCPEPDNDNDGVPDAEDNCPLEPEDMDGFQDEDGCPEPDNDSDGILDAQDRCPLRKGDKTWDGCPQSRAPRSTEVTPAQE